MLTAARSGSLDDLILLLEYFNEGKKHLKELKELRKERDKLLHEQRVLDGKHEGAKALAEATITLSTAQTAASNILSEANTKAKTVIDAAEAKAGNLEGARMHVDAETKALKGKADSFEKTSQALIADLDRRDKRMTKREEDNARARADLKVDQETLRERTSNVAAAMKGKDNG